MLPFALRLQVQADDVDVDDNVDVHNDDVDKDACSVDQARYVGFCAQT
jgi:hypothetical protein